MCRHKHSIITERFLFSLEDGPQSSISSSCDDVLCGGFVLVETEVQALSSVAFTLALLSVLRYKSFPVTSRCVTGRKTIIFPKSSLQENLLLQFS